MLREVIEAEDLQVFDAANGGAEGVQKAQKVKPGLIILDLSMPVMNGLDAARELKVLMPHVPVLMFTNNAGGIVEKEARSAGISAVISKSETDGLKPNCSPAQKHFLAWTERVLNALLDRSAYARAERRKIWRCRAQRLISTVEAFLANIGQGRKIVRVRKKSRVYAQGE